MSELAQDVTVETEVPQDNEVIETTETPAEETEADASPEVESEEVEQTVEEKLEKAERASAGKQKAIDRKTAAYHALQRKYDERTQEFDKLNEFIQQQQPDKEPSIDDYDTHDEYVNALVTHRSKAEVAKQQEQLMLQQQNIQNERLNGERIALRQSQEVEYMTENPMYKAASNEVAGYIESMSGVSDITQDAVISQLYKGNVPKVIDYFGSNNGENLDELGKISQMSAPDAAVEIYKLQQKLSASSIKNETKPKPSKPVKVEKGVTKATKSLAKGSARNVMDWVNS